MDLDLSNDFAIFWVTKNTKETQSSQRCLSIWILQFRNNLCVLCGS